MGEIAYAVHDSNHAEAFVQFSESDDDYTCLCTFPHNCQGKLNPVWVRSLALLGAAVVLLRQGEISADEIDYVFLPDDVPAWIRKEIDRVLGVDK